MTQLPPQPAPASHRTTVEAMRQAMTDANVRRWFVTGSAAFCAAVALPDFGLTGTSLEDTGGYLGVTATLLAPAKRAFSIWSAIYLGLLAYVGWQWLPKARDAVRARDSGWLAGVTMILSGLWILLAQAGSFRWSAVVIVVLWLALVALLRGLNRTPAHGVVEWVGSDVPFSLYLGWVTVVMGANLAAALHASGVKSPWVSGETWGVLAVTALLGIAMVLARYLHGRIPMATATAWGFGWLAYARAFAEPRSYVVAIAAVVSAFLVLLAAVTVRLWYRSKRTLG